MNDTEAEEVQPKNKLDEDTLSYFKRVENVIEDDDFDDEEAQQLFIANVSTQIEGNELALSCDQAMSRVLERLLEFFNDSQLKRLWICLSNSFKIVTTDRFGSHVMQNLVNSVPKTIRIERDKVKERKKKKAETMEQLFLTYCTFASHNLDELVGHVYGSHVLRAVFEVLAGVHVMDNVQRSRNSRGCRGKAFKMEERKCAKVQAVGQAFGSKQQATSSQTIAVPESFVLVLEQLTSKIMDMDLSSLVFSHLSCPVLQTLLLVLHEKDDKLCSKLCKKIMSQVEFSEKTEAVEKSDDDDDDDDDDKKPSYEIPALFTHDVGSHLVEKILHVVSTKQHKKLFKKLFKGHLEVISLHPVGNYLVQHLLASTTDPTLGEQMLDELLGEIEEIFSAGHDGVIARMAELSVRLEVKQDEFQDALLEAFHCSGKKERKTCSTLILSMTTYDIFFNESEKMKTEEEKEEEEKETNKEEVKKDLPKIKRVNFHGAILVKTLLDFQEPGVFADSILHMSIGELKLVSLDPMGSRTIEAFLKSKTVKDKKKNKFCDKIKDELTILSCDKHASHVVETCWREVDAKHKELIVQELSSEELKLGKDFYGSKVMKNCGVATFKRKTSEWKEKEEKASKKRQVFEKIIKDSGNTKKKSKGIRDEKKDAFQNFAVEMADLGFSGSAEDLKKNNNKNVPKALKPGIKMKADDDIDLIFKAKKSTKLQTTNDVDQEMASPAKKKKKKNK